MTEHETENPQESRDDQQVPDRQGTDSQGGDPQDRGREGSDQEVAVQRAEDALAAFERAGSPTTLDASLQALARTDQGEHAAAFARVHARLRRALDEAPEGLPSTGAASGPTPGASS